MRRLGSIGTTNEESAEINLSPLIDMVFLLLIFFMVTTVFVQETGVEVHKPRASSAEDLEKSSILLAVTRDGAIVHGGRDLGLNRVRGLVARLLKTRDMPVIIIADEQAATGRVVEVIDQCKAAGATKVSIAARRHGPPGPTAGFCSSASSTGMRRRAGCAASVCLRRPSA